VAVKNKDYAIKVDHVTMKFNMASERVDGLKEYVIKMLKHQLFYREFIAVDDVSFEVKKGEVFGIVGTNGSGKSTMLKIVSGILEASSGTVETVGKIAPLIELGAGFDGDLTARENIFLNGAVLGYDKEFIEEKFTSIVDFAELWDFLDMPIKNYSSGMVARIAFAIATVVKPDILIVDEILAVGDFLFQQKCENRIRELMAGGTTVLIVSHSIDQIEKLCDRVLWIEKSKPKMIGPTFEVCNAYRQLQNGEAQQALHEYQIVQTEKCHVCGEVAQFRNEIGMTHKIEAFCSNCGAPVRLSDTAEVLLEKVLNVQDSSIQEQLSELEKYKIMLLAGKSAVANCMKQSPNFEFITGDEEERIRQIENIREMDRKFEKYDVIIVEELLPYVKDVETALSALTGLLTENGILLFDLMLFENVKTQFRARNKNRVYRNSLLLYNQWGTDFDNYIEKLGLHSESVCCHKWYASEEQVHLDKMYEKCMSSHPYYLYKFNSWVAVVKRGN